MKSSLLLPNVNQTFNSKRTKEFHHKNHTTTKVFTVNRIKMLIKVLKLLKLIKLIKIHQEESKNLNKKLTLVEET